MVKIEISILKKLHQEKRIKLNEIKLVVEETRWSKQTRQVHQFYGGEETSEPARRWPKDGLPTSPPPDA